MLCDLQWIERTAKVFRRFPLDATYNFCLDRKSLTYGNVMTLIEMLLGALVILSALVLFALNHISKQLAQLLRHIIAK
jgi:hypothetical protein